MEKPSRTPRSTESHSILTNSMKGLLLVRPPSPQPSQTFQRSDLKITDTPNAHHIFLKHTRDDVSRYYISWLFPIHQFPLYSSPLRLSWALDSTVKLEMFIDRWVNQFYHLKILFFLLCKFDLHGHNLKNNPLLCFQSSMNSKTHRILSVNYLLNKINIDSTPEIASNFTLVKQEIQKSVKRYNAVKFGSEFDRACCPDTSSISAPEQKKSWPKIDPDKHSYYKNLHELQRKIQISPIQITSETEKPYTTM